MSSFEDFLSAMTAEDKSELSNKRNDVVGSDNLGTARQKEILDTDVEELFDLGFDTDGSSFGTDEFHPDIDRVEVQDDDELEDDTADIEDTAGAVEEGEEDEYEVTDWSGEFKLPDGTVVNGAALKEFNNFSVEKEQFQELKNTYHQREKLIIENADIGMNAIQLMKEQLMEASKHRALNTYEKAQADMIRVMENKYIDFSNSIRNTYQQDVQKQQHQQAEMLDNNVKACFDKYPNLGSEISGVKDYLKSKGFEADSFLKQVAFDPKVISILMDASTLTRSKDNFNTTKPVVKAVKGVKAPKNVKQKADNVVPHGISSHSVDSYNGFINAMGL